jgi:hypothetical protein
MKDKFCIPENLIRTKAGSTETARLIRTGMRANSIRAQGLATAPQHDAGYMAATFPSAKLRFPLASRGGQYMYKNARKCLTRKTCGVGFCQIYYFLIRYPPFAYFYFSY